MIHVACAADAAYLPHAATMLRSLLMHNDPRGTTIHFLHASDLDPGLLALLDDHVRSQGAHFHAYGISAERCVGLPIMGRIPAIMWLRIFLPELLPNVGRVLYLDCDTLIMQRLDELWRLDFEGAYIAAVSNVFEASRRNHARDQGLESYFNSGVLLIDLEAWRRERVAERILAIARDPRASLRFPDQDALNRALAARWRQLHPAWNCQNSLFYFRSLAEATFGKTVADEARVSPRILHFEGGEISKPWHYLCKHPWRAEYFRHRKQTPWPRVSIEGTSPLNRLLRPLPLPVLIPTYIATRKLERFGRRLAARLGQALTAFTRDRSTRPRA